jgi:CelD/BcsL family acetyltransferase involved in cellulose biosynthesis
MPSTPPLRIVVEPDLASFSGIWPASRTVTPARCYAYQCADILDTWCRTIGAARDIRPCFVAVLGQGGDPLLLVPLGVERRRGLRILGFLDGGVSDVNAPIVFDGARGWDASVARDLWRQLCPRLPPFDVAWLTRMPERVEDWPNPLFPLRTASDTAGTFRMTLPADWDGAARGRLPGFSESRRRVRKLATLGEVSFTVARDEGEAQRFLAAMMQMKSRQYLQRLGRDRLAVEAGAAEFYVEVTRRLFANGTAHLSALRLGPEILAAHWGYVVGEVFYHLMPAFRDEPEWRPYAPGRLLNEFLMEWSSRRGLKFFDFGVGEEPYKVPYADLHAKLHDAVLPVTLRGRLFGAYRMARRRGGAWWRG